LKEKKEKTMGMRKEEGKRKKENFGEEFEEEGQEEIEE